MHAAGKTEAIYYHDETNRTEGTNKTRKQKRKEGKEKSETKRSLGLFIFVCVCVLYSFLAETRKTRMVTV